MPKRKVEKHDKYPAPLVYFFFASCFLILGVFFKILDIYKDIDQQILITKTQTYENNNSPKLVKTDKLNLNLAIEGVDIIKGQWPVSKYAVTYLKSSEKLAGEGSVIIYGHNKINVFGQLGLLKIGDQINLTLSNNENINFTVYQKVVVSPNQLSALKSSNGSTLILYTCTGFADSNRLVVKAKLT